MYGPGGQTKQKKGGKVKVAKFLIKGSTKFIYIDHHVPKDIQAWWIKIYYKGNIKVQTKVVLLLHECSRSEVQA
ncbi:hypothetical protein P8452_46667 [Trifolium repens]|nr:hypothetical protein P8452_46667 [Trifolium repens]